MSLLFSTTVKYVGSFYSVNLRALFYDALFIVLAFLLAVIFLWDCSPARSGFLADREIFNYLAWSVNRGLVLYRDVFDHKTPVFVWFLAIFPGEGPWADWSAIAFLTACTICVQWFFMKSLNALTVGVFSLSYLAISTSPKIIEGGGLTHQAAGLLLYMLLSGTVQISTHRRQRLCSIWGVGVLSSLILLTQPECALPAIPLILLSFTNRIAWNRHLSENCLRFIGGVFTVLTPFAILISIQNVWGSFLQQAILFNWQVYIPQSPSFYLRVVNSGVSLPLPGWLIMLTLLCSVISFLNHINPLDWMKREGILLCSIFTGLCAAALSGRASGHYYLEVVPSISFLLSCGLCELQHLNLWRDKKALGTLSTFVTVLCFFFAFIPTQQIICGIQLCGLKNPARVERLPAKVDSFAQHIRGEQGSIFVLQSTRHLWVHRKYDVISPSRFIYLFPFLQFSSVIPGIGSLDEVIKSVETRMPNLIIDCSSVKPLPPVYQERWAMFITAHYRLLSEEGKCIFYRHVFQK